MIAAWLFAVLNSGEHSDVLEGVIILVAAGLMLYVSGWLMVKQDPRGWQDYLAHKADHALAQDTGLGGRRRWRFSRCFAKAPKPCCSSTRSRPPKAAGASGCSAGLAAATAGLVVLFYFINLIAQRIPLRPLFIITSAFLFAMAIKFIGEAMQEFQEQAIIPVTDAARARRGSAAIGFNPTLEALSIQLLVILFALATYSVFQRNARLVREDKARAKA